MREFLTTRRKYIHCSETSIRYHQLVERGKVPLRMIDFRTVRAGMWEKLGKISQFLIGNFWPVDSMICIAPTLRFGTAKYVNEARFFRHLSHLSNDCSSALCVRWRGRWKIIQNAQLLIGKVWLIDSSIFIAPTLRCGTAKYSHEARIQVSKPPVK